MNRAERRKRAKQGVTASDLKTIQEITTQHAIKESVRIYSTAVAMVMRDKLGFGKVRMERTLNDIQELFDAMTEGYVSVEDLQKTLYDECDVLIV